jgi:hypothetical protein
MKFQIIEIWKRCIQVLFSILHMRLKSEHALSEHMIFSRPFTARFFCSSHEQR